MAAPRVKDDRPVEETPRQQKRPTGVEVYERLRDDIVARRIEFGTPLIETELAGRYGMSRTPVREALRRLEQDGLLERNRRGVQIRTPSPEEILEIYEVRIELEALAAALAAEHRSPLDLARLTAAATAMETVPTDDPVAMAAANHVFHRQIWEAAHNATLYDLLTRLLTHLTRYPSTTLTHPGRWETVLREHREILALITAGSRAPVHDLAAGHMRGARDARLQMYALADS